MRTLAGTGTTRDCAQAQCEHSSDYLTREVVDHSSSRNWTNLLSGLMALALVLSVMLGFLILIVAPAWAQSAVLLPNGKQQFLDSNGAPLAGGQVFMYVAPATTTPKTTWMDAARVTPNTNPVMLDSSGEALIYGVGTYRQLVKDAIGNVIWDAQTNGLGGNTYAGVSTGSANAQVGAANDFANVNGSQTSFTAGFTNSSTMTYNAGFGAWPVVNDTSTGPVALTGGEIHANNFVLLSWDSVNSRFHIVNNIFSPSNLALNSSLVEPYNTSLSVTASGGVLTVALKTASATDPSATNFVVLPFRSPTYASGVVTHVNVTSALSQTISNGSTLGVPTNNSPFRLWIVAFNNGGSVQIGLIVCTTYQVAATGVYTLTQFPLQRGALGVSFAEGGSGTAGSSQTFYTATALTNKAYVVLGEATWENGLATIGTWTVPTRVQNFVQDMSLPGEVVQTSVAQDSRLTSGTTLTPWDNTIPQNIEGDGILGASIVPSSAANIIMVTGNVVVSSEAAGTSHVTVALIKNNAVNAVAATVISPTGASLETTVPIMYTSLGSLTIQNWEINVGASATGTTINGAAAAGKFGGVSATWMQLQEIMS